MPKFSFMSSFNERSIPRLDNTSITMHPIKTFNEILPTLVSLIFFITSIRNPLYDTLNNSIHMA